MHVEKKVKLKELQASKQEDGYFFRFLLKKKTSFCSFHTVENIYLYLYVCIMVENTGKLGGLCKYNKHKSLNGD